MLDALLGRAALKERIEELEEERRHLQRQLDAEQERKADAVTDLQDAEERGNRLADRVTELEDRVQRLQGDDADLEFRKTTTVRGRRLVEMLDRLGSLRTEPEGALTAVIADKTPESVQETFGDRAALVSRAAPCIAVADDAGFVAAALEPPALPDSFTAWSDRFELEREWFVPTGTFTFAFVRSDRFAIGEYDGADRQSFEGFTTDVKSKHSKGGFSQGRFERRRDAQIEEHLDRCLDVLDDHDSDRLYVVGERTVLDQFKSRAVQTATVDASGDPVDALDDAFREFWTTRFSVL